MSKNTKVEGENVKEISFDVKDLNLDERIEFMSILKGKSILKDFGFANYVNMVRIATTLTDDEINVFTDEEITSIAWKCYSVINKKKLKK